MQVGVNGMVIATWELWVGRECKPRCGVPLVFTYLGGRERECANERHHTVKIDKANAGTRWGGYQRGCRGFCLLFKGPRFLA